MDTQNPNEAQHTLDKFVLDPDTAPASNEGYISVRRRQFLDYSKYVRDNADSRRPTDQQVKAAALGLFQVGQNGIGFNPPGNPDNRFENIRYLQHEAQNCIGHGQTLDWIVEGHLGPSVGTLWTQVVQNLPRAANVAAAGNVTAAGDASAGDPAFNDMCIGPRQRMALKQIEQIQKLAKNTSAGYPLLLAAAKLVYKSWNDLTGAIASEVHPNQNDAYYKDYIESHMSRWFRPRVEALDVLEGSLGPFVNNTAPAIVGYLPRH